jgi:hypothetical protein
MVELYLHSPIHFHGPGITLPLPLGRKLVTPALFVSVTLFFYEVYESLFGY